MATITSAGSGAWATGGTWVGGSAPADNDAVVIAAGHSVLMDADLSSYTGLQTVTITSHATTPAMLYFANGTSGHLKLRTGYNIVGTNAAAKGRLLANSNGTWGGTTALAFADKAVIDLQGTAKIDATYLDIALYCTQPSNLYVETYKTAYTCTDQTTDVNTTTNVITFTGAPPSAGTAVRVKSSGTLPGGLSADEIYYTRTISGNTCKLALQNDDVTIMDITSTGSGTLTMYDGHTDTATATMNVVQDVTGDTAWVTTDGHDRVVLADIGPDSYDQQRLQLTTINSGTIVLSANVDSAQFPLARIVLSSRNVSIRSAGTSNTQPIVDYASATTAAGVFQCEIINTGGTGTTFRGYGINNGTGHTISGTVTGCSQGVINGSNHTVSGVVAGCSTGIGSTTGCSVSGVIIGCSTGTGSGCTSFTLSGSIFGCSNGVSTGTGSTISGAIIGCSTCIISGIRITVSGTVTGGATGLSSCVNCIVSGKVSGCGTGISSGASNTLSGTVIGCYTGVSSSTACNVTGTITACSNGISGSGAYVLSGTISNCTTGIYAAAFTGTSLALSGNTADVTYSASSVGDFLRGRSFRHADTANDTRAWSGGGSMTHETTTVPSGKSYSHKFTHVDATYWTVMEWEIDRTEPLATTFTVHAKHDATSLAEAARLHWQIIDPASDPLVGGTALDEWIASDSTDWQSDTITVTRTDDRPLLVRVCAQRGSGNSYCYIEPMPDPYVGACSINLGI